MPDEEHADALREWEHAQRSPPLNPWVVLAQGVSLGVIMFVIGPLKHILQVLATLIHELGHAAAAWAFGVPAIPAFDFVYGGGVTMWRDQSWVLLIVIYLGLGALLLRKRDDRFLATLLGGGIVVHVFCVLTRLDDMTITLMGHGTELVFAGIFLYRGLTGSAVVHAVERPLYAAIGVVLVLFNAELSFKLLTSAAARAEYMAAKGGALEMDFVKLANTFLHVPLTTVAALHLLACVLPPVLAFAAYRHRHRLVALQDRLDLE